MTGFGDLTVSDRRRLGAHLRQMREDAGLLPASLAAAIGRDRSTVTRIEAGDSNLTIDHIVNLRRDLGFSIDALIDITFPTSPFVDREERQTEQGRWRALSPIGGDARMFELKMFREYHRGSTTLHDGDEYLDVVEGEATVTLGTRDFTVLAGHEAIRIPAWQEHRVTPSPQFERTVVRWVLSPEGVHRHTHEQSDLPGLRRLVNRHERRSIQGAL